MTLVTDTCTHDEFHNNNNNIIIIIIVFISVKTNRSTNIHTQTPVTQDRNNRFRFKQTAPESGF